MRPQEVLAALRERGIEVGVRGDKLLLRPASLVDDELRQLVVGHKPQLLSLLRPPPSPCRACGVVWFWLPPRGGWACALCQPPAPGVEPLAWHPGRVAPLVAYALRLGARPAMRLTVREGEDERADAAFVARLAELLGEFPGRDVVVLSVRTLDGRRLRLLWRAQVTRELRLAVARLLRERAVGGERRAQA